MRLYYLTVGLICITVIVCAELTGAWWLAGLAGGVAAGTNIGHYIADRQSARRRMAR